MEPQVIVSVKLHSTAKFSKTFLVTGKCVARDYIQQNKTDD